MMRSPPTRAFQGASERYTPGGLLIYAAIVPVLVVVMAAPVVSAAFLLGALTALVIRSLRTKDAGESRRRSVRDTA